MTFWTAQTGGTQVTNLTNVATSAVFSVLTTNSDGSMPLFTDPANHVVLWADGGAGRFKIYADPTTYTPGGGTGTSVTVTDDGNSKTFTLVGTAVADSGDSLTFTVTS